MKQKIAIISIVLALTGAGVAYFFFKAPGPTATPPISSSAPIIPSLSQDQLQKGLQEMVTRKAELRSLQIQLAVYEKLLKQFPQSKDLQQHIDILQQRIKELE